jgi:hypothetical protein
MKKISLKEHFKNHFRKVLSEAAPPLTPTQSYDPTNVENPIDTIRDRITPTWMNPSSTDPWGNQPPNSPWQTVPREIRELFPKGPKQFQAFQQGTYEYYQTLEDIIRQLNDWIDTIGETLSREQAEQMVRLYLMNDPYTSGLIDSLRNIFYRLYLMRDPDGSFADSNWEDLLQELRRQTISALTNGGIYRSIDLYSFGWSIPGGFAGSDTPEFPGWKPQYTSDGIRFLGPVYFPNGIVYVTNPLPPGDPQWYQWNEGTGRYEPIPGMFGVGNYGEGPTSTPAIPSPPVRNPLDNIPGPLRRFYGLG